jgi:hypothetical protein
LYVFTSFPIAVKSSALSTEMVGIFEIQFLIQRV